jgi:hypothetical protein
MRKQGVLEGDAANMYIFGRKVPRWGDIFQRKDWKGWKGGSYQETSPSWVRSISGCLGLTLVCAHILY